MAEEEECLEKCEESSENNSDAVEFEGEVDSEGENEEEIEVEEEFEEELVLKKKHKKRKKYVEDAEEEGEEYYGEEEEDEDYEDESSSYDESSESSYEEVEAITFEWEDEIYEFVELVKPKRFDSIFIEKRAKREVDRTGKKSYLQVLNSLHVPPVERFYQNLEETEIDLSYYGINPKGMRGISKVLGHNTKVQSFSLKDNKLSEEACHFLGLVLMVNKTLTHLDLTGCRIGTEGIRELVESLSENETLKVLNLTKCYIGDEGMKLLATGIKFNNGLQSLNLSHNSLAKEGAEALGSCFSYNTSICDLDLDFNDMFDPGGLKAFFKGIMDNEAVTRLVLSWNGLVGEEVGKIITAFLKKRKTISYLDLSANRLDRLFMDEILPGLQSADGLQFLKLGGNPIPSDVLDSLLGAVTGMRNLKVLDLEGLWVKKSFMQTLNKIKETREIEVVVEGVLSNYEIKGPDYKKILLDRARYEALKPKAKKAKKDFGHFLWNLGDEPMNKEEFLERLRHFKAKISSSLLKDLLKEFQISKTVVDVKAMREKYLTLYPDSKPAPEKKKKDEIAKDDAGEEEGLTEEEAGEIKTLEGDETGEEEEPTEGEKETQQKESFSEIGEEGEELELKDEIVESDVVEEENPSGSAEEISTEEETPELRDQIEDDA